MKKVKLPIVEGEEKSNKEATIVEQLRNGTAQLELLSSPSLFASLTNSNSHRFFAKIGNPSLALKKVQHFSVQKVTGDGRCLFRSLAKGMALNKGISLNPREERDDADELRMAVKEVICGSDVERQQYEEAVIAITVDEPLKRYCQRIGRPDFWGGESELLVLSKLCNQPIIVYIPEHEYTRSGWGSGFIPIAEYGAEFHKGLWKGTQRKAVRLLYSGNNHYDLLV